MKQRKILSAFIAFAMVITMLPVTAVAAVLTAGDRECEVDGTEIMIASYTGASAGDGHEEVSGSWIFLNDGTGVTILEYTGTASNVIIPSAINGNAVTSLGGNSFRNKTNIASITIPASITGIHHGAFQGTTALSALTFLSSNPPVLLSGSSGGGGGGSGTRPEIAVNVPAGAKTAYEDIGNIIDMRSWFVTVVPIFNVVEASGPPLSVMDAVFVLRHVAGIIQLTIEQEARYDMNGDGEITTIDSLIMLQRIVGLGEAHFVDTTLTEIGGTIIGNELIIDADGDYGWLLVLDHCEGLTVDRVQSPGGALVVYNPDNGMIALAGIGLQAGDALIRIVFNGSGTFALTGSNTSIDGTIAALTRADLQELVDGFSEEFLETELLTYGTKGITNFNNAMESARNTLLNNAATSQEIVAAHNSLTVAFESLHKKAQADLNALLAAVKPVYDRDNVLNAKGDPIFTAETWVAFTAAYNAAVANTSTASNVITDLWDNLNDTFVELERIENEDLTAQTNGNVVDFIVDKGGNFDGTFILELSEGLTVAHVWIPGMIVAYNPNNGVIAFAISAHNASNPMMRITFNGSGTWTLRPTSGSFENTVPLTGTIGGNNDDGADLGKFRVLINGTLAELVVNQTADYDGVFVLEFSEGLTVASVTSPGGALLVHNPENGKIVFAGLDIKSATALTRITFSGTGTWTLRDDSGGLVQIGTIIGVINENGSFLQTAAPFSTPLGGTFAGTRSVTLASPTLGTTIFYTLDGSTPTRASTRYTGAFNLSATTTIKAIAVREGMEDSAIMEVTLTRQNTSGGNTTGGSSGGNSGNPGGGSSGSSGGGGGGGGSGGSSTASVRQTVGITNIIINMPITIINTININIPAHQIQATSTGAFTLNAGAAQAGQNAVLVRYNERTGELEFVTGAPIGRNGNANLNIAQRGDYLALVFKTGDITGTGEVETSDALALLRHIAGITELSSVQLFVANGKTGETGTVDALNILRYVAGLTKSIN
ncbi:MAG: chitobiase/beta-hexosaminidase C-terminal domain-containing protein [Oscillospiraceae bacterium]|jgi:hypothetical protein|nr:chitobiase/beta-hexosaminidase C-terminal domain-containing protein [Oscillospiraceae bacterium]